MNIEIYGVYKRRKNNYYNFLYHSNNIGYCNDINTNCINI